MIAHLEGGPHDGQTRNVDGEPSRMTFATTTTSLDGPDGEMICIYKDAIYERVGMTDTYRFTGHAEEPSARKPSNKILRLDRRPPEETP